MKPKSLLTLLSAGALTLSLSGGALAEAVTEEQAQDTTAAADQQEVDLSNKYKVSALQDLNVEDSEGQEIGSISELIIDQDGQVSHIALQRGGTLGMGGETYLVPWDRVQIDDQEQVAKIDVSQDQFEGEFAAFEELPETALERDQAQQQDQQQMEQQPETQMEQSPETGEPQVQ